MNYDTKVNVKDLRDFLDLPEDSRRIAMNLNAESFQAMHKDWLSSNEYTARISNEQQTYLVLFLIEALTYIEPIAPTMEQDFYFTFPQSSSLRNGYMCVSAISTQEARNKMINEYGKIIFAFSYTRFDFIPQIAKYDLYEIPFGYMPED